MVFTVFGGPGGSFYQNRVHSAWRVCLVAPVPSTHIALSSRHGIYFVDLQGIARIFLTEKKEEKPTENGRI